MTNARATSTMIVTCTQQLRLRPLRLLLPLLATLAFQLLLLVDVAHGEVVFDILGDPQQQPEQQPEQQFVETDSCTPCDDGECAAFRCLFDECTRSARDDVWSCNKRKQQQQGGNGGQQCGFTVGDWKCHNCNMKNLCCKNCWLEGAPTISPQPLDDETEGDEDIIEEEEAPEEQQQEDQQGGVVATNTCAACDDGQCMGPRCYYQECTWKRSRREWICLKRREQHPAGGGRCRVANGYWRCTNCPKQGRGRCCKSCVQETREPTPAPWLTPEPTTTPTAEPSAPPPTQAPTVSLQPTPLSRNSDEDEEILNRRNFLFNIAGVNINYDILEVCDKEWGSFVNCVQSTCSNFEQVCADVNVPSNLPLPTSCTDIETNFCNQFVRGASEHCCLHDCASHIQDLSVCVANKFNTTVTTLEGRCSHMACSCHSCDFNMCEGNDCLYRSCTTQQSDGYYYCQELRDSTYSSTGLSTETTTSESCEWEQISGSGGSTTNSWKCSECNSVLGIHSCCKGCIRQQA